MSMSPQYPVPGETVIFIAEDYTEDLRNSTLTWTVNGVTKDSGIGDVQFQMTAAGGGATETVGLTVSTQSGTVLQKSLSFTPESVDILWQAHSFVPPLYQGKALFPYEGTATFTAMPSFALNTPQKAVYSWSLGGSPLQNVSGYGKNTITLTQSILMKPLILSVVATSPDGSISAENSITLNGTAPVVVLYQDNLLYGMLLNQSIGTSNGGGFNLGSGQVSIRAIPYFFDSTAPFSSNTSFEWNMNGQTLANETGPVLTVAAPAGQSGSSAVSSTVSNPNSTFQTASANTSVTFTNQPIGQ